MSFFKFLLNNENYLFDLRDRKNMSLMISEWEVGYSTKDVSFVVDCIINDFVLKEFLFMRITLTVFEKEEKAPLFKVLKN